MQRTESSTFDDSQTLQRQAEFAVGDAPSGIASQTGLASRQIGAMHKDPENVGEHTRLACSDGRPGGRSSSSKPYKITSTGKPIDDALEAVEKKNPNGAERHRRPSNVARRVRAGARIKLKNVLNRNYTQLQIDPADPTGLIDLIATIPSQHANFHAKNILCHFPKSSRSNSHSASLGDLCASAVKNSLIGNTNFAWVQHMLHHLAPNGSMALLVPKHPASSDLPDRMAVWKIK